jgi:hypothetical protein
MPSEDAMMSQPDPDIMDLANIICNLRQEVVALQQDNEELRDELARAAHTPATPAMATTTTTAKPTSAMPVAPAHTETRQPKMALPDAFDGSHSNLKHFGTQYLLYIAVRSNDFLDDLSQIAFVLSLMKGCTAGPWATRVINPYSCVHVGTIQSGPSGHVWQSKPWSSHQSPADGHQHSG